MSDNAAASPRWIPLAAFVVGMIAPTVLLVSSLMTISGWRAGVDLQISDLQKRMEQAEGNQRTYIPVLVGLSKDVTYLAERARREDDRQIRDHR